MIRVAAAAAAVGHHFTAVSNHLSFARSPFHIFTRLPGQLNSLALQTIIVQRVPVPPSSKDVFAVSRGTRKHAHAHARQTRCSSTYVCPLEDCWTCASWRFSAFAQSSCVHERNICAIFGALCVHCTHARTRTIMCTQFHAGSQAGMRESLSPILSHSNHLGDR